MKILRHQELKHEPVASLTNLPKIMHAYTRYPQLTVLFTYGAPRPNSDAQVRIVWHRPVSSYDRRAGTSRLSLFDRL